MRISRRAAPVSGAAINNPISNLTLRIIGDQFPPPRGEDIKNFPQTTSENLGFLYCIYPQFGNYDLDIQTTGDTIGHCQDHEILP
jgi:hypothetical protein